ncbi:MAG TPA: sugar transferase [Solirubrobacterales bacterium]|nr:sugar transferase [Solirubrobacterales bacterium]
MSASARAVESEGVALSEGAPGSPASESLAEQYARIAHAYEGRPIDAMLRGLDVLIAGFFLLVLSPIIALVSVAIRVLSGRPVLYRGERVGRAGRVFEMYKFRTLARDAETRLGPYLGPELTRRTEREVTAIGRALRATHLDEIPQLWNVLRGEMSMVGPRPIRPPFFAELCARVPQYWQRLVIRPGVTGFAQTRMTREESWADKLAHDMEYIADRSVRLYLRVLTATAWRVTLRILAGRGDRPAEA